MFIHCICLLQYFLTSSLRKSSYCRCRCRCRLMRTYVFPFSPDLNVMKRAQNIESLSREYGPVSHFLGNNSIHISPRLIFHLRPCKNVCIYVLGFLLSQKEWKDMDCDHICKVSMILFLLNIKNNLLYS